MHFLSTGIGPSSSFIHSPVQTGGGVGSNRNHSGVLHVHVLTEKARERAVGVAATAPLLYKGLEGREVTLLLICTKKKSY